ncbi:MAG: GNAT family N-acetyltransferase [bacterium]
MQENIIAPIEVEILEEELGNSQLISNLHGYESLYITNYKTAPNVIRELSRLREITFRAVEEGTGKSCDTDIYDTYYDHIILWNRHNREIMGSYRLAITKNVIDKYGTSGLYNSSQYEFRPDFQEILQCSIEFGRSFVQSKYWKTNALDHIWRGIGSILLRNPEIRYMWGAVSISDSYSELAKNMIVSYYNKWYKGIKKYFKSTNEFILNIDLKSQISDVLTGNNYKDDFRNLKNALANLGFTLPVLLRKYTDMADYGGSLFYSFAVDPLFCNSIDCMIIVDLNMLKSELKERYLIKNS